MTTTLRNLVLALVAGTAMLGCFPRISIPDVDLPQRMMSSASLEASCNQLYQKTDRNKRLSWKGHVPVVFFFDPAFPTEFRPSIVSATKTWNEAAGYELIRIGEDRATAGPANDGANVVYFSKTDAEKSWLMRIIGSSLLTDKVATTHRFSRANRLVDTDVVFDGINNVFTDGRLHVGSFDIESVALHEFGHALGLDHNPDPKSTMYEAAWPFEIAFRGLDDTTIKMLDCEYK